jgi:CIC family chloride channel protein
VQEIALGTASPLTALALLPWYWKVSLPAIGGLLIAPIVYRWAVEAKGHGVPEVMEAVALRGGVIRARVAFAKALASAIPIGSGGSAGREGPVVQIGSALGSTCGQLLPLSPEQVKTLVGCGAAGGITATFNAPIAGALFALEVILGSFAVPALPPSSCPLSLPQPSPVRTWATFPLSRCRSTHSSTTGRSRCTVFSAY